MGMISAAEYAERNGYKRQTVLYWCKAGWIEGVRKEETRLFGGKMRYLIPEDAKPQKPLRVYKKKPKPQKPPKPKKQKPKPEPKKEPPLEGKMAKVEHILRYCGVRTYRQLAEDTGWPIEEVRRIYEELHDAYGV